MSVELLGSPSACGALGEPRRPKGRKTWALLAYLLLAERAPSRSALAEIFHSGANDPLGALRWSLADLRRLLGRSIEITGDPVSFSLTPGATFDLVSLDQVAVGRGATPGLLLEGLTFSDSPELELWLDLERHRVQGRISSIAREAAMSALASGETDEAVRLSERLVQLQPFDERHHALLVRSLVASGDSSGAQQRASMAAQILSEHNGTETKLVDAALNTARAGGVFSPRSIEAVISAGRAAMGAGVPAAALRTLGTALVDARNSADTTVLLSALLGLAEALIHSVRGLDDIALDLLYEAEAIAAVNGDSDRLAAARREIGYVELLHGDYSGSDRWFNRAVDARPGPEDRAMIDAYRGSTLVDRGRLTEAITLLDHAIDAARGGPYLRPLAFALAMLGRAYIGLNEHVAAVVALGESVEVSQSSGWVSFQPFPEALLAQALIVSGKVEEAAELAEASFALACEVGDPCWEGISGHSLALGDMDRGDLGRARDRLEDAYRRATRLPDGWMWLNGYLLAALCEVLIDLDPARAAEVLDDLEEIAYPSDMGDLTQRARAIRGRLESRSALKAG